MTQACASMPSFMNVRAEPSRRRVYHLSCGGCGADIVVPGDSNAHHVSCPQCEHSVKVLRTAAHVCEFCGANCIADLTNGATVGTCEVCDRPYTIAPATAPLVASRRRHRRRAYPRQLGGSTGVTGVEILITAVAVLFSSLVTLWLVFS